MVRQVQAAFDALLDIAAAQDKHLQTTADPFNLDVQSMLESTARDLLALGDSCLTAAVPPAYPAVAACILLGNFPADHAFATIC